MKEDAQLLRLNLFNCASVCMKHQSENLSMSGEHLTLPGLICDNSRCHCSKVYIVWSMSAFKVVRHALIVLFRTGKPSARSRICASSTILPSRELRSGNGVRGIRSL